MTERTETFLNAMTIFGMVLVGLMIVIGVALGVMLAMGKFNPQYDALVGLKFNKTASQEILENGGEIELIVTSVSAEVSQTGAIIADNTEGSEIVLTVRPTKNSEVTISNIIDVPSVVEKNKPFKVKAKLASDGSNQGGVCYIYAMTKDMLYRVAEPIEIKVDVPVEEITLSAVDSTSGDSIDLANNEFIYLDTATLSVNVMPTRSLYVFGDKNTTKAITYVPDSAQNIVEINGNKLTVSYYQTVGSSEDVNDKKCTPTITARIQKYSVEDRTNKKVVETSATLNVLPLQLGNILIKNSTYSNAEKSFATKLFSGDPLLISAQDTEIKGVVNLDVYLEPTIKRENVGDDYNPLSTLMSSLGVSVKVTGANGEEKTDVINITQQTTDNNIPYWKIKPTRLLEAGEQAQLIIGINDDKTNVSITRDIEVTEVQVDKNSFVYNKDGANVEIDEISLTITKKSDSDTNIDAESNTQIYYSFDTSNDPTFKKVVMFATKVNGAKETAPININEVNSQIILANKTTNQIANNIDDNNFIIYPRGAGKVKICAYLVRTNEAGEPVDVNYNVITTDSAKANQSGYVLASSFCKATNISSAKAGDYIVQQEFSAFTVTVYERLTGFNIYTSADFTSEVDKTAGFTMGTGDGNAVTLYLKPNSTLAISRNASSSSEAGSNYATVIMNESATADKIFGDGLSNFNITNTENCYKSSGTEFNTGYQRWFEVTLIAQKTTENITSNQCTINLSWTYVNETSSSTELKVTTKNVPVSYITINDADDTKYRASDYGVDNNDGYWRWQLSMAGFDNVTYSQTVTEDNETKTKQVTYYRWNYTATNNASLIIPKCKSVADAGENKLIKTPTSSDLKTTLFMFNDGIISSSNPIISNNGENTYNSIDELIKALSNSSVSTELKKELWQKLANRMDSMTNDDEYPQVTDYAQINNSTSSLTIKKAIPSGYSLYMFYSDNKTSFVGSFTEAGFMPIAVKIEYSWPTVTAHIEGNELASDVYDRATNKCYIDSENTRAFTLASIKTAKINFGGEDENIDINYTVSLPTDMSVITVKDENNPNVLTFKLDKAVTESTVTIERSFNYVIMSDDAWQTLTSNLSSSETSAYASAIDTLKNQGQVYNIGTESLTFVVSNADTSTSSGSGEGE